jgi:hypothetical protein
MTAGGGRLHSLGAAAVIGTAALAFWYVRIILPAWGHSFSASMGNVDFFTQIYPMSLRGAAWIRQGIVPLWNPYQFAGHPFLATGLYGVCYPPNVLYLLLPTEIAIEAVVVAHMALAGWFTYLYTGAVGVRTTGRYAGAAVYMFCGFMASQASWFTPAVASSTWLPLALLAVERIIERRDARGAVLLAVALALALLGGWVQFWLYSVYAIALYAGARLVPLAWRPSTRPAVPRIVVLLGIGIGLGVAVTAVQLLPTRELQALGPRRPGGLSMEQLVPFGSLLPARVVEETLDWRAARPYISPFYLGPVVLALVASSVFSRRGFTRVAPMWGLFVASFLVSIAVYTPFFEYVYLHLPAARWFRLPQRIVFLFAFAAALLAAFGIDALSTGEPSRRVPKLLVGLGALGISAAFLATRPAPPTSELILVGVATLAFAAAVLASRPRWRNGFAALLVLVVVADYAQETHNPFWHPYHGLAVLHRQDAILDYVHDHQEFGRTYLHDQIGFDFAVMPKQGSVREIYSITDYEPLSLLRFSELYAVMGKPRGAAFPFTGWFNFDPSGTHGDLLHVLSLRYWVVAASNGPLVARLSSPDSLWRRVPVPAWGKYLLFEFPTPLPRAYVATHAKVMADGPAGLAALTAPDFDLRQTVILEMDTGLVPAHPGSSSSPTPITPARIIRYEPDEVVIEADALAPGYLVLTDTYYPGWQATVDGAAVSVYPANHVVRAVPIEAGHHLVTFRYQPLSVRTGAWLSGVSLLVIVALGITNRPRPVGAAYGAPSFVVRS